MIQVTPQMRVLVALESVDGRKGIDGLVQLCKGQLAQDPYSGSLFLFRNRSGHTIRMLAYDGQGFYLIQKRLSSGRFKRWPTGDAAYCRLRPHQVYLLFMAGDPSTPVAPNWRELPTA
jgi:transposase